MLAATGARAQAPTLVKDIFPGVSSTAAAGAGFERILGVSGGRAFLDGMEDWNRGLWVSDGTAGGTRAILDLDVVAGTDVDGTFFFGASAQDGGSLWKTDGTAAGTVFVSRFSTNPSVIARVSKLTKVGSRPFFVVDDGVHGAELWTSDGTTAGTKLVKDLTPGAAGSFDHTSELVDAGGTLFFTCRWDLGCGLWKSDGSEAGTTQLADLESVASLVNVNGTLFFRATDPTHGSELWKSDGTPAGTVLVHDIVPGVAGSSPNALVAFGGALYFRLGSDGSTWKSDGTEAGTILVHTFPTSDPLVPSGSFLYSASGTQLWASDGTSAGTALVRDFGTAFFLRNSTTLAGALHLWVDRDADGLELWKSDGTPAGTTLVKVVEPGNASPFPLGSVSIPGASLHLLANMPFGLWRSDGTPAGTAPVQAPVFTPNDGLPVWLTDVNGTLLFSATDAEHGQELWRSDGSAAGTFLVKDLQPGFEGSGPSGFVSTPSIVFFQACVHATGCELYRTDGTESGTWLVEDLLPGPESGFRRWLGTRGELLLFTADDGTNGAEPWRSDGSTDGTHPLGDLTPGPASSEVHPLGMLNGAFLFSVWNGTTTTLWRTDGSTAGTIVVGPMPAWNGGSAELGDVVVFAASETAHGTELWRTDGTAAGTTLLLDINPHGDSSPFFAGRLGNRVLFWADDGVHGTEPWVTDGTAAGTTLLKDINPGPARSLGIRWAILGSTLYFFAYDGVHGHELWRSDGTPAGTVLVRDVAPGPAGSMFIESFAAAGHEVFFTASNHVSGRELWRSDGTEARTSLVADLAPGLAAGAVPWSLSLNRVVLARSGGRIYFTASDGTTGHELWSLPTPLGFHAVTPCRVADTRDPVGPTGGVPLGASQTLILPVAGRCGIPSTAISVAANVTVVSPSATGSFAVFAGGPIVSGTTEVPVTAGRTRALHFLPILGTAGSLSVRSSLPVGGSTDLVLDVSGYFE
jgi:ELWxxDGT repeat protein